MQRDIDKNTSMQRQADGNDNGQGMGLVYVQSFASFYSIPVGLVSWVNKSRSTAAPRGSDSIGQQLVHLRDLRRDAVVDGSVSDLDDQST